MQIEFSWQFLKNPQISNFMKIGQVEAELYVGRQTDWWTDMIKLVVAFCNLANVPNHKKLE